MDSLRNLASPNAHVIRDGQVVVIPSSQVVVGDLVELKTGESHDSSSRTEAGEADLLPLSSLR